MAKTRQERRALRLQKMVGNNPKPPANNNNNTKINANNNKEDVSLSVLGKILSYISKPKQNVNNNAVNDKQQQKMQTPPVPPPANDKQTQPKPPNPIISDRRKAREEKRIERANSKHTKLYNDAVSKDIVKEGSTESIYLKQIIPDNYDEISKLVKETADPNKTKIQNTQKHNDALIQKQLVKSGVQYVNTQQQQNN